MFGRPKSPTTAAGKEITERSEEDEEKSKKNILGVKVIWVRADCRGRNIASALLDSARSFSRYGSVFSKDSIAFSQPTAAGCRLAAKYSGKIKLSEKNESEPRIILIYK